jgi:hypothetical protein
LRAIAYVLRDDEGPSSHRHRPRGSWRRWHAIAGGVIDEFPIFEEFFLAMVDYNRARALKLRDGVRR